MPTRASKPKSDPNVSAFDTLQRIIERTEGPERMPEEIEQEQRSAAARLLASKGASKGGHARAKSLSAKKRADIAKRAAAARWRKSK